MSTRRIQKYKRTKDFPVYSRALKWFYGDGPPVTSVINLRHPNRAWRTYRNSHYAPKSVYHQAAEAYFVKRVTGKTMMPKLSAWLRARLQ